MSLSPLLDEMPLVAILRGVRPDEAVAIGEAAYATGFRCLETSLNSPDPLESIGRLSRAFEGRMLIGAGTVLTARQVAEVAEAGGQLIVSPNVDVEVIRATKRAGLISLPGMFTPTEAFAALAAGADALKLFPAEAASPLALKALRAVLPSETRIFPVGGIDPPSMAAYLRAGAAGFGIGSAVYRPGQTPEAVNSQAAAFVAAWRSAAGG